VKSKNNTDAWGRRLASLGCDSEPTLVVSNECGTGSYIANESTAWIRQSELIRDVGIGGYRLAVVNRMQCDSGTSNGTFGTVSHDWGADWKQHAVSFNYYEGLNVLGLDTGWKIWPWNWF
jgi:hypothetical protein